MTDVIKDAILNDLVDRGYDVNLCTNSISATDTEWVVTVTKPEMEVAQAANKDYTQAYIDAYRQITAKDEQVWQTAVDRAEDERFYSDLKSLLKYLIEGTNDLSHPYNGSSEYELHFGWRTMQLIDSIGAQLTERCRKYYPKLLDKPDANK